MSEQTRKILLELGIDEFYFPGQKRAKSLLEDRYIIRYDLYKKKLLVKEKNWGENVDFAELNKIFLDEMVEYLDYYGVCVSRKLLLPFIVDEVADRFTYIGDYFDNYLKNIEIDEKHDYIKDLFDCLICIYSSKEELKKYENYFRDWVIRTYLNGYYPNFINDKILVLQSKALDVYDQDFADKLAPVKMYNSFCCIPPKNFPVLLSYMNAVFIHYIDLIDEKKAVKSPKFLECLLTKKTTTRKNKEVVRKASIIGHIYGLHKIEENELTKHFLIIPIKIVDKSKLRTVNIDKVWKYVKTIVEKNKKKYLPDKFN